MNSTVRPNFKVFFFEKEYLRVSWTVHETHCFLTKSKNARKTCIPNAHWAEPNVFPQPWKPNAQTPAMATSTNEPNQWLQGGEATVKTPNHQVVNSPWCEASSLEVEVVFMLFGSVNLSIKSRKILKLVQI